MNFQLPTTDIEVGDIDNLHLDIYTIGYREEGESLLLLLCDEDDVLHTTLTDCYSESGYNHVDTILNQLGINKIDAFIWTHPDADHSTGISVLLEKYDPNAEARVFLPQGISEDVIDSIEARLALKYVVKKYNSNRHYCINYVSLNDGEFRQLMKFKIKIRGSSLSVDYVFYFILPNADVIERRMNSEGRVLLNDYSIFYIVTFNGQNYLFSGDLSKQNVQFIKEEWLDDVVFVKIPHHGSKALINFNGKLVSRGASNLICTCTTFRSKHLPDESVLNSYKNISRAVFCTGKNENGPHNNYGCVCGIFNANMKNDDCQCTGNAFEFVCS